MDSNNMYQNQNQQTDNPTPDNNQNGYYQGSSMQGGDYSQNQNTYTSTNNYQQNAYTGANNYQPNPYNNGGYQQQPYQQPYQQTDLEEPVSLGEWLITYLIMIVPCVSIIMMFVWAFGSNTKKSKSNFCKAILILYAVSLVLMLFFGGSLLNIITSAYR